MATGLLGIRVDEVMRRKVITIDPQEQLSTAATTMLDHGIRHLPVVNGEGELEGILSERDLRARIGVDLQHWTQAESQLRDVVANAMSPDPLVVQAGSSLRTAMDIFEDERIGAILVVDEGERLVGMLSYIDVLDWIQRRLTQPGTTERPPPPPVIPPAGNSEKTREITGYDATPAEATLGSIEPPPLQQADRLPGEQELEEEPNSEDLSNFEVHQQP
jgi:CBS domain-containing protein